MNIVPANALLLFKSAIICIIFNLTAIGNHRPRKALDYRTRFEVFFNWSSTGEPQRGVNNCSVANGLLFGSFVSLSN